MGYVAAATTATLTQSINQSLLLALWALILSRAWTRNLWI